MMIACESCSAVFSRMSNGHRFCSKQCYARWYNKKYYEENREKVKQQAQSWKKTNPKYYTDVFYPLNRQRLIERAKQWAKKNPDKLRANVQKHKAATALRAKQKRLKNIDKAREYGRMQYQHHRLERAAYGKRYRRLNPERVKAAIAHHSFERRKLAKQTADGTITISTIRELYKLFTHCPYCGTVLTVENRHLDHIYPLAKGGLHILKNLIPCCADCNHAKRDYILYKEWMPQLELSIDQ